MKIPRTYFCVILTFFLLFIDATAQLWLEATPLKSSREDVTKIQSGEQRLTDGSSYFELDTENITVKYYDTGCLEPVIGQLGLSLNLVIQIKSELKYRLSTATLLGRRMNSLEKTTIGPGKFVYIDHDYGFVVISQSNDDHPELVKAMYYIPKSSLLPRCLLDSMDVPVRSAFVKSAIWKTSEQTDFYDHLSLKYPQFSSMNIRILDLFVEKLKRSEKSMGYIYVYAVESSHSKERSFWIDKLQRYLVEDLRLEKGRFKIIDAGHREKAAALLIISTKRTEKENVRDGGRSEDRMAVGICERHRPIARGRLF